MPLSAIALKLGINKSKLAHYDKLGLLVRESDFPGSKFFGYDFNDVKNRLQQIKSLRKQGLSLKDIKNKLK
jgi:DNA-binding transcriptional MerR regulator